MFDDAAARAGFTLDADQRRVADRLARFGGDLNGGVYVWGPVGRGKSWLTTVLFDAVGARKRRFHFHEFYREFHAAYARHRHRPRAVDHAVAELLGRCRFVCFDEFHLHDPGDAMLAAALVKALFDRGIALLTTSNYPPSGLMPNPLYHHLAEPLISLIEARMDVVELAGDHDYRTDHAAVPRSNFERGRYLWPGTDAQLSELGLTRPRPDERRVVTGRHLRAEAVRGDLVWFDFAELCATPTSTVDYLALVETYPRWVISGLPRLDDRDSTQRFANVVDVLCDRDATLVLIGAEPWPALVASGVPIDFARTASRLALL
ncbi:cell division protein ZapE [Actinokineospora sp. HUAS TT18]|uniref:cell division protein ZapE n=1 Tax=Actinokineospora sp. HUAS TT18 TaxID=3447451 RepID=UPI003F51EEC4